MKLKNLVITVTLMFWVPVCSANDKMLDAIKHIDPDYLNQLLIPGFFIRAEEKRRYLTVAQEMTNRTFAELQNYSLGDVVRFFKGSTKFGLFAAGAAAAYLYHKKVWDISRYEWADKSTGDRGRIISQDFSEPYYRYSVYGTLGVIATYFLRQSMKDFSVIGNRTNRLMRHRNALAVEAVIQRLPVCDPEICSAEEPTTVG